MSKHRFTDYEVLQNIGQLLTEEGGLIEAAYTDEGVGNSDALTPIVSLYYDRPTKVKFKKTKQPLIVITQQMLSATVVTIGMGSKAVYDTRLEVTVTTDTSYVESNPARRSLAFANELLDKCRRFDWRCAPKAPNSKGLPIFFENGRTSTHGVNQRGLIRYSTALILNFKYYLRG